MGGMGDQPPRGMADHRLIFRLSQDGLQIFFRCFDGHDVELVHQNIKNIGRDKRRQAGSQSDVLYSKIEQGQQNCTGFLLIPGKNHRQGQIVYFNFEDIGQCRCYLNGRIGIIALSDIQQSRNPANVAEILVKKTKLAAGQGQDDAVIGNLLDEFSVIITAGLGAVATTN